MEYTIINGKVYFTEGGVGSKYLDGFVQGVEDAHPEYYVSNIVITRWRGKVYSGENDGLIATNAILFLTKK